MGYIKKLKNNELVGGTDKTTIYPVTSAEAVFEEVGDKEFKSQKYLNNHITNERIVDNTIENRKLKDDTIDMGKLNTQLKTIIQNAYDASWKVKEEPFSLETKYDANDVVYDPETNSSYVSLTADNQGNPVNPEDEGYVEGKWRIIINGISAVESTEVINETVGILEDKFDTLEGNVDEAIEGLDNRIDEIQDDLSSLTAYETAVTPSYDAQIPLKNLASTAQVGYYFCTVEGSENIKQVSNAIVSNTAVSQIGAFSLPPSGGHFKVKMSSAHTATSGSVTLRFGNVAATNKPLYYNGEPVSATNSWDAGEVLSVYYDGTYYQASNAQGGSNKKIDAYLYGDLRTLAVGQVYEKEEAVKTTDKQLRRMTKDVNVLSLSETLVTGDIKVSGSKTYRAASAINTFNPSTSYSAGAYALGSMTVYTLTVSADTVTAGNITVNGTEVAIESTDDAAAIATKISSALNIDGWTDSASENVVTVRCNTIGNNTTAITITDTDNTGVAVASSSVAGTSVTRKYDGETWTNASVSGMVTDGILVEVDVAWLITNATQQNSVVQDIEAATTYWNDINIASIANSYVGMYNSGGWKWQNNKDNNYGKFVSIEPGRRYKMVGGTSDTNYALLKNNTHATGNITNFATGETGRTLNSNATVIITPPADAKYLYFRTNSNGGLNRTPQSLSVLYDFHDLRKNYNERFETIDENLETLDESIKDNKAAIEDINNYPNIIIIGEESVDIASLEERDCSLGSNGKWFYNGSVGKHKIIEVTPDNIIGIKVSGMSHGFYGWLTPSYTPPSNNDIIPYAVGTTRGQLSKKDSYTYIRVPINAKYLVIGTVDGGSGRPNWEVANCTYKYRHNNFTKFRFAHWNIGHFSGYDGAHASSDSTITPENAEAMARRYKQVINDVGADILGIAEYDPNFTTDGQKAKDVIFQCYNKILEGTKQTYNCNTLMFNGIKYINNYEIQYTSRNQSRYIKLVKAEIGGRPIYIVETHWDFDTAAHKRSQATQLLNLIQGCQYVIISGDLNTSLNTASDIETLQMFKDAGFEFANNGYLDPFTTATNGGSVDHIMVKGFSMSNRHTVEVSGTLSDHYLLCCDLVMNP